jgi:predicted amidohydrolase
MPKPTTVISVRARLIGVLDGADCRATERPAKQGMPSGAFSSDLHLLHIHGRVFDLPTTLLKFIHLALPRESAIRSIKERTVRRTRSSGSRSKERMGDSMKAV